MQAQTGTGSPPSRRGRGGRPSADRAGDVDRRILEAATELFLEFGFDATSCDQVAVRAGAGKASIYARHTNKEALFAAVVRHHVERTLVPAGELARSGPVEERLRSVGCSILDHALRPDVVALMRVVLATAHRMPELARLLDRIGREAGVRRVAEALVDEDSTPALLDRARLLADRFIDLAFVPHQMRALVGDDPCDLAQDAPRRVDQAVHLLEATGWLAEWK